MENLIPTISAIGTIAAIIFGTVAMLRNGKKDSKDDGAQMMGVVTDIRYIKDGTDRINKRLDSLDEKQEKQHIEVTDRLAKVEESAKSAHKRIDRIEKGT